MRWAIAAPFIDATNSNSASWIEKFVPGTEHQFQIIPRSKPLPNWHDRKRKFTTFSEWGVFWNHAFRALNADVDGLITVFPQLAAVAGIQQTLRFRKKALVAWLFNVGTCRTGYWQKLAAMSARNVDISVVHTRREIELYSEWLRIPRNRFEFVPYQVPEIEVTHREESQAPFLASMGSAHRDFPTLLSAIQRLNIRSVIATGNGALDGCKAPACVETPTGLSRDDCAALAQRARINVIPLKPKDGVTAAGQVTIAEAMMMGRPLIVTNLYGAEDYITHGETGWLVQPNSAQSMAEAIDTLWNDEELRSRIGRNAQAYARQHFTDKAAGLHLKRVLDIASLPYLP